MECGFADGCSSSAPADQTEAPFLIRASGTDERELEVSTNNNAALLKMTIKS